MGTPAMHKAKNRLSKERRERQRRYREHHHTPTHFLRLRLPAPRVQIDQARRWYGVRTLAHIQRKLQVRLGEAGFTTWLPGMAIAGGIYRPIPGTVIVGLNAPSPDELWAWHDREMAKGIPRPFHDMLGPIPSYDLQRFADWLTGYGAGPPVFTLDDAVVILEGPFAGFAGYVQEVNPGQCLLKASVALFGRQTIVTLPFSQVECIAA